jgi:hypothetical protein
MRTNRGQPSRSRAHTSSSAPAHNSGTANMFHFNGGRLFSNTNSRYNWSGVGIGCAAVYQLDQIAADASHISKVMGAFGL